MRLVYWFILLLGLIGACKSLEDKCLDKFPVTTTEVVRMVRNTDTILLAGEQVTFYDTTECLPSTEVRYVIKEKIRQLPPREIVHEYQCIDTVVMQERAGLIAAMDKEIAELKLENERKRGELKASNKWMWWVSIIGGSALVVVVLIGGRSFLKGFKF